MKNRGLFSVTNGLGTDALPVSRAAFHSGQRGKHENAFADTGKKIRSGLWTYNRLSGTLSLSQMVVLFGYIFQEYSQGRLARMLGINSGTVHAF